jgi:hypothetical protein
VSKGLSFIPLIIVLLVVVFVSYFFWEEAAGPEKRETITLAEESLSMPVAVESSPIKDTSVPKPTQTPTPTNPVTSTEIISTPTPTDRPSPAHTPTSTSSSTNSPTPIDTPTVTDTPEPIDTPIPADILTPTDTPIPIIRDAPILIDPQPGASQYRNRIDLEWSWVGVLGPDAYFQVEIRNRYNAFGNVIDESVSPIDVAWVKDKFYRYDRIDESYDREYTWRIIVVRGTPPREKDWSVDDPNLQVWEPPPENQVEQISLPSEMRTLYVEPGDEPPPPPDDGDGGGGGGDSGGGGSVPGG